PTMSRHPVTPMDEADVRAHLARQTQRKIGLVDLISLKDAATAHRAFEAERRAGAEIIALDVLDEESLAAVGELIWKNRGDRLFAIGSQGLEYALIAYWQQAGLIAAAPAAGGAGAVDRIAVVS